MRNHGSFLRTALCGLLLVWTFAGADHPATPPGGYKGCGGGNGQGVTVVHDFAVVSCTHGGGYIFGIGINFPYYDLSLAAGKPAKGDFVGWIAITRP